MRGFHVLAGMPRAGSTLLQNLMNQRPDVHVSSTSCLAQTVRALSTLWSRLPEVKSDIINDKAAAEARMTRATQGLIGSWYLDRDCIVIDKGRIWNHNALLLHHLYPQAVMLVCVRDLREIFASVEKQHARTPMFDDIENPIERTTYKRADGMFAPEGFIGQQIAGVEDLLRRNLPYVEIVQYEQLVARPHLVMQRIEAKLGLEPFAHDFDNVENTADDVDALYLHKFPHQGDGKVEDRGSQWQTHVSTDIAQLIMDKFPTYNRAFGYR